MSGPQLAVLRHTVNQRVNKIRELPTKSFVVRVCIDFFADIKPENERFSEHFVVFVGGAHKEQIKRAHVAQNAV